MKGIEVIGAKTKAGRALAKKYGDKEPSKRRRGQIGTAATVLFFRFDTPADKRAHAAVKRLLTVLEKSGYDTTRIVLTVPRRKGPGG